MKQTKRCRQQHLSFIMEAARTTVVVQERQELQKIKVPESYWYDDLISKSFESILLQNTTAAPRCWSGNDLEANDKFTINQQMKNFQILIKRYWTSKLLFADFGESHYEKYTDENDFATFIDFTKLYSMLKNTYRSAY